MVLAGVSAGDKGIQAFDFVNKPVLCQKIQGPICDRRLGPEACLTQQIQYGIGTKRSMLLQQQLQHLSSDGRKAKTSPTTLFLGGLQRPIHAKIVIVQLESKQSFRLGRPGLRFACHGGPFQICGT